MAIEVYGLETYFFINGLAVPREIVLGSGVTILPAKCDPHPNTIVAVAKSEVDLGIAAILLRQVSSQIRVATTSQKDTVALAWNAQWDIILLCAILNSSAAWNLQSNVPAENFAPDTKMDVTNYNVHVLGSFHNRQVTEAEAQWIEVHFATARKLLDDSGFMNAAHAMISYHWHPSPRTKLAILWSGIEGLFQIESELVFRTSLYCARFLSPNDENQKKAIFSQVKALYKLRSLAVHGSQLKSEDADKAVVDSAQLLQMLIKRCIEAKRLPDINDLAP